MLDVPANMNNVTYKYKVNDFTDFAIVMPPVAWQLVVTVIYWPHVEIFKQTISESHYITFSSGGAFGYGVTKDWKDVTKHWNYVTRGWKDVTRDWKDVTRNWKDVTKDWKDEQEMERI